jgi:hypothetical protein
MKFFVATSMAVFFIAAAATAQHANIGVKAGLNIYTIHTNNNTAYDSKTGLNLGLMAHIHLSRQIAFQPELVYSGQGAKYTIAGITTALKLDYINVPLLLQYMFDNGFRLEAGPQVGFLASAKSETNNIKTDIKNNLKSVEFGLGFGLGYIHPPSGFGVDARYNLGLSNINENTSLKSTNNGFQLGVFYLFKHKS